MIQPLLTLDEAREELRDTEASLARVLDSPRIVDPERQRERVLALTWWRIRQLRQIAELEAAT